MEGLDNILSAITSHFVEVYKSDNVEGNLGWVHSLPELVLPSMNDCLTAPVSDLEIKAAVDGMGATKSPGPDRINGMFFQGYWEIVGHAVCAVVHSFFNEGVLPREINVECYRMLSDRIIPQRGLRQGDPLSTYLFILAADALSHLLTRAKEEGRIRAICLAHGAPILTHLFFFCR